MKNTCLLLFTKTARPGNVKTRLIPAVGAERAARLHSALLGDLVERLEKGDFHFRLAWALGEGEDLPGLGTDEVRQVGEGLGERLFRGFEEAVAEGFEAVAAVGSDHPELDAARVTEAFTLLADGVEVVIGPSEDGGYYLIALGAGALRRELFEAVPWSTAEVLEATLERCRRAELGWRLLDRGWDVDRPEDLERLERAVEEGTLESPRVRELFTAWSVGTA